MERGGGRKGEGKGARGKGRGKGKGEKGNAGRPRSQPNGETRQALSLLKLGSSDHPLACASCSEVAVFIIPLSEGDVFNDAPNQSPRPSVALCDVLWEKYNVYREEIKCYRPQCSRVGIPFASTGGTFYECNTHTKRRAMEGKSIGKADHPRRWKELKDTVASPPTPPLERIPLTDQLDLNRSGSSATYSTASNKDDLEGRLKELGG